MGNTINKNHIWALLIILVLIFAGTSSTRLKFGNVFLKDTLTGSMKITSGGIYVGDSDSGYLAGVRLQSSSVESSGGYFFASRDVYIDDDGYDLRYVTTGNGDHLFNDNVTIDSILTLRSSANVIINGDDKEVTVDASFMKITSDDATSTNRTFTLTDGTYSGQVLIIHYFAATNQAEIVDGGSESGLNGTMTFDNLDESLTLIWNGTYWVELTRIDN